MKTLWQDLRYAARMLARSPGFTVIAVLSLALGIGINTTIFSFVNAALFRPLPVPQPERLVRLYDGGATSYPDYVAYRDRTDVFENLAAYTQRQMSMNAGGETEQVWGEIVTGNYFDVLGVQPMRGRGFLSEEDGTPGTHPVVVISHALWERRFNSDPDVIGRNIFLSGQSFTIVGITGEKFVGASVVVPPDLWVPIWTEPLVQPGSVSLTSPDDGWLDVMGRLKPGASVAQAEATVDTIAASLNEARRQRNPGPEEPGGRESTVTLARGLMVPPEGQATVLLVVTLLMTVVSLVLLVACANVANMLLARAAVRRKEVAVRLALGAGRWRIVRQLLTESILLSILGGAAGLLLALWSADVLLSLLPQSRAGAWLTLDVSPDGRVLAYTLLLSLLTGVVFGLVPALQASKPDLVSALKDETVVLARRRRVTLRNLLVVGQVAVSLLLLVCAGLFLRNLRNTHHADPGFSVENGFVMSFDLGLANYKAAQGRIFHEQLLERVRALPEVRSASLAEFVPLGGARNVSPLYIEGEPAEATRLDLDSLLSHNTVGLDYFKTMDIPLVRGRDFNSQDTKTSPPVIIINETLARRIAPDGNPVGKRLRNDSKGEFIEVIGVAHDIKYQQLAEKPLFFGYLPLAQRYRSYMTLHVRTAGDPGGVMNQLRAEVQTLDRNLPLTNVKTFAEHMREPLAPAQLLAQLSGAFGMLALLLAAVGIYGVMAYLVSRRTREIGIRMALGARRVDVLRLVLFEGLSLVAIGITVGLSASFAATRVLASVLYGVSPTDPWTFAGVSLVLALVTLLACYVPARRATKVDPMVALRYE